MSNVVVTARIASALSARLDELAAETERSRSWLVAKAIEQYVDAERDLIEAIKTGEADIAAGRVFTQEQVEQMFDVKRDDRRAA